MSKYLALSFVAKRPGRLSGLNFWNVDPSGDYSEDWHSGELLALEALEFMAKQKEPNSDPSGALLASAVLDMPRRDDRTGVELGFLNCIGYYAAIARRTFGDKHYRDFLAESQRRLREADSKMEAKRSEHARKAARARWAKCDSERLAGEA